MARFLRFVVEEALTGGCVQLKESVVGHQVFDKPPSYDSRIDPVVRVEARRLRDKLDTYYQREGKEADVVIELPKGGYLPAFSLRDATAAEPAAAEVTLAVLPFNSFGTDKDFVGEGLTEDLISALTRVPNLRVSAWTSASRLKEQQEDLETVQSRLGVRFVVRGSVRVTGDRIRVNAHLIDAANGQYAWSETFDRQFADIFVLEDEITQAIVKELSRRVHLPADRISFAARAQCLDSYELCVKGSLHARERTPEGLRRSVLCFDKALEIDPDLVTAHIGLGDTFALQAEYGLCDGPQGMKKARASIERALALDPKSAEAHASLALILDLHDWAWDDAERAYLRSFELNNNYAPAHQWYSVNHLAAFDRYAEAEEHIDIALKLDPLSPLLMECKGFLYLLREDFEAAIDIYRKALVNDPSFHKAYGSMGRAYTFLNDYSRAFEMFEQGLALTGEIPHILGALGQAYGLAGRREQALGVLERLRSLETRATVPRVPFAFIYLGLGRWEEALACLEKAVNRRESSAAWIRNHPGYASIRHEPGFQALVDRVFPPA